MQNLVNFILILLKHKWGLVYQFHLCETSYNCLLFWNVFGFWYNLYFGSSHFVIHHLIHVCYSPIWQRYCGFLQWSPTKGLMTMKDYNVEALAPFHLRTWCQNIGEHALVAGTAYLTMLASDDFFFFFDLLFLASLFCGSTVFQFLLPFTHPAIIHDQIIVLFLSKYD